MSKSAQEAVAAAVPTNDAETMLLAPGVMETIIRIAVGEVEGVVGVCSPQVRGPRKLFAPKPTASGVEVVMNEDGKANVALHLTVSYGRTLPELADQVREAVAEALASQVGVNVGSIDVYVDGIAFN